jgi:hypothetical protein
VRRIFGGTTYANVTATLALVVALGGTAYAAATVNSASIVDNSVQGIDLRNGTVASVDVATNGITSADLANRGVRPADIAAPPLSGVVQANGNLLSAIGATGASRQALGHYYVNFPMSIGACPVTVTPIVGDGGVFATTFDLASILQVYLTDHEGDPVDAAFAFTGNCPPA